MAQLLLNALRARRRDERGMAVVMSLMVCLVVFLLGAVWLGIGTHQLESSGREKVREQARNAAEAGLNAAMSQLTADASWTGSTTVQSITGAEWEATVSRSSSNADDPARTITATGYAPSKASPRRVTRRLTQQISLVPTDTYRHALFASPGNMSVGGSPLVTGDVYAAGNLTLENISVSGTVTVRGNLTTKGNSTYHSDIRAGGDITFDATQATEEQNMYANGKITGSGTVKGNAQAGSTISGVTVNGSKVPNSPPGVPPLETLPQFTPVLTGAQTMTVDQFNAYWAAHHDNLSGTFVVTCPCTNKRVVSPAPNWKLSGDTMIVSDAPVTFSDQFDSATSATVNFTVVSYASDGSGTKSEAVRVTNLMNPAHIRLVVYVPNGTAFIDNNKMLTGVVYAASLSVGNNFTFTYQPPAIPGFESTVSTSTHFSVQAGPFREVPAS